MSERMTDNSQRLVVARAAYDAVPLYDPKRAPVDLDLTDNTNLWGMPPVAERTWREMPVSPVRLSATTDRPICRMGALRLRSTSTASAFKGEM